MVSSFLATYLHNFLGLFIYLVIKRILLLFIILIHGLFNFSQDWKRNKLVHRFMNDGHGVAPFIKYISLF